MSELSLETASPAGAGDHAAGVHVLVIDDDEVDRRAVRRALDRASVGAHVSEAASAAATDRLLGEHRFDCVFLDYNIPGSDGLTLLRMIRSRSPGTPVVMLTGQGDEQVAVELMKAGAVDYLPKAAVTAERLASSLRYALELKRAAELTRLADEERRESAQRSRLLAEASAILTQSIDPRDTIGEVARLAVPLAADYCVIYGLDERGNPVAIAAAHHDPAAQGATALVASRHRPERDNPASPVALCARTGERVMVDEVTDDLLVAVAGDSETLAAFRTLAPASVLVLPLRARRDVRGVMVFGRTAAHAPFRDVDVDLAEDLAHRTALAFDNAGLYEAAERARLRTERLQQVTARLAAALPQEEVGSLFVEQVREALAADTSWVALLEPESQELVAIAHSGFDPDEIDQWQRVPADPGNAAADVLAAGLDRWFTRMELEAVYPHLTKARIQQQAFGVLPLDAGNGPFGVMTVGFNHPRVFHDDEQALARALAGQFAQALERARLYDAERDARERAELANRAKSEFLARMSHDLRTPLNAIGGYAELVEMGLHGPVTPKQQDAMFRIRRAKDHLLTLINDILSFAKLEAGQVTINVEDVRVDELVREARPLIEPQVVARQLSYTVRSVEPVTVRADRERLMQVLLNLFTNAVKFTDEGGIEVEWERSDGKAHIHVRDTGRGIAADRVAAIFDPFVQAGDSDIERQDGVGLGLAISRELMRLMDGELTLESTPGEGSVFTLSLPLVAESEKP